MEAEKELTLADYAEHVRQQTAGIVMAIIAGRYEKAGVLSLGLCEQSADIVRTLQMEAEPSAGNYDLAALATMPMNAPETDDAD